MSKTYKACLYLRISNSDKKNGESESLSNQRRIIQDFAQKHNDIEIVSEKVDDGYTGLLFDRPAFKEMMQEVYEGNVDCIIVKDLSRLGREYIDTGTYLRDIFPKYNVRFIAISDNIDTKQDVDLSEKLDVTLKTVLNDAYSKDISKKIRSSLKTKRENGEFVGSYVVYGYKKDKNNKNKLVIDEYASEVVKDIFNMRKSGLSAVRIADVLNDKGILSPIAYRKERGLPYSKGCFSDNDNALWSATAILRILKNEIYLGDLLQGKKTTYSYKLKNIKEKPKDEWNIVRNTHEAIISREEFDLVQKLMQVDTRIAPNQDSVYLFSGILICGCCGCRMTRKTVPYKDKKYYYYYCTTGKKNGCTNKMFKEDVLIENIFSIIKSYVSNIVTFSELQKDVEINKSYNEEKYATQINDIQNQIDKIKSFKSKLYESLLDDLISKSEHNSMKRSYDIQLERLKKALADVCSEQKLEKNSEIVEWSKIFKDFEDMSFLNRNAVIHLIHSITVFEKIEIKFRYQAEFEHYKSEVL